MNDDKKNAMHLAGHKQVKHGFSCIPLAITVLISACVIGGTALLVNSGPRLDFCTAGQYNGVGLWLLGLLCLFALVAPFVVLIGYIMKIRDKRIKAFLSICLIITLCIVAYYIAGLLGWTDCPSETG